VSEIVGGGESVVVVVEVGLGCSGRIIYPPEPVDGVVV